MTILNAIGPLVIIVALGAILRRKKFLSAEVFQANSRLVYWIGLPCLLFLKTAKPVDDFGGVMKIFLVMAIVAVVCTVLAYVVSKGMRLGKASVGAFVQASFRGNLAFVGLPIVLFSIDSLLGKSSPDVETWKTWAVLAFAPLVPLYNVLGVLALVACRDDGGGGLKKRLKEIVFRTVSNPLIISCGLGLLWSVTGWELPVIMERTLGVVAGVSLTLALFAVGASLRLDKLREGFTYAMAAGLLKCMICPLLGYFVGIALGLSGMGLLIAMIYLACPTAVAAFVMAEQMGGDEELTAKTIVLTVLLCLPVMAVILALHKFLGVA